MKDKTGQVKDASDELKDKIIDEVLPAMEAEWKRVREVTSVMALQAQELRNDLIPALERYVELWNDIQREDIYGTPTERPEDGDWVRVLRERTETFGEYSPQVMSALQGWLENDAENFSQTDFQALINGLDEGDPLKKVIELARVIKMGSKDWQAYKNEELAKIEEQLANGNITEEEAKALKDGLSWIDDVREDKANINYNDLIKNIEGAGNDANSWIAQFLQGVGNAVSSIKSSTTDKDVSKKEDNKEKTSTADKPGEYEGPSNGATANNEVVEIGDHVTLKAGAVGTKNKLGKNPDDINGYVFKVEGPDKAGKTVNLRRIKESAGGKPLGTEEQLTDAFKIEDLVGYRTGGYTGDWGPEGKLALLHEKELVLNSVDTENLLKSVEIMRSIDDVLNSQPYLQNLMTLTSEAFKVMTNHDDVLQQEVTIHADFPNVTDHSEIEEAINNLINGASQYAHRNTYDRYLNQIK